MLISTSHQFILFLPQKCAASTLSQRLAPYRSNLACDGAGYFEPRLGRVLSNHVSQRDAHAAGYLDGCGNYFKAAFVRNPYDRVYSWFRWFQRVSVDRYEPDGQIDQAKAVIAAGEDTDGRKAAFIKRTEWMRESIASANGDVNRFYAAHSNQYSLASTFTHHEGRQAVDWIGHVECFERDFDVFCERAGIEVESRIDANRSDVEPAERCIQHPLEMSSEEHEYLERFNRSSIRRINRNFAEDFKLLGYRRLRRILFSGFRSNPSTR